MIIIALPLVLLKLQNFGIENKFTLRRDLLGLKIQFTVYKT